MNSGIRALMASNKGKGQGVRAELTNGTGRLYLYDVIGMWYIEAQDVIAALAEIGEVQTLHVHINSPGGDVFEARAIRTALERYSRNIIVHIDGIAASAASFLMMAGKEIEIAQGAFVMIHNSWGMTIGDRRDHEAQAGVLAKIDASIAADYERKAGAGDWPRMMDEETWISADEAVEMGLVDRVFEAGSEKPEARFDLSAFSNVPQALAGDVSAPVPQEITVSLKLDDPDGIMDEGPEGLLARVQARFSAMFGKDDAPLTLDNPLIEGARADIAAREAEIAARESRLA